MKANEIGRSERQNWYAERFENAVTRARAIGFAGRLEGCNRDRVR